MRVITPGHVYELTNVDGDGTQVIQFVHRRAEDGRLLPERDRTEGIQSQELLRVLINRTMYLHNEQPWSENVEVVHHLRDALRIYEQRASRAAIEKLPMPERIAVCGDCQHMFCFCGDGTGE